MKLNITLNKFTNNYANRIYIGTLLDIVIDNCFKDQ